MLLILIHTILCSSVSFFLFSIYLRYQFLSIVSSTDFFLIIYLFIHLCSYLFIYLLIHSLIFSILAEVRGSAHIESLRTRGRAQRTARFIHHFTRFQAHGESGALEKKMHRDTIMRIEDSLRATAEGTLKWLQGPRVTVPIVDLKNVPQQFSPKNIEEDSSGLKQAAVSRVSTFVSPQFPGFLSSTSNIFNKKDREKESSLSEGSELQPPISITHIHNTANTNTNNTSNTNNNNNSTNNIISNSKYSEPIDLSSFSLDSVSMPHRPDSMPTTPTSTPPSSLKGVGPGLGQGMSDDLMQSRVGSGSGSSVGASNSTLDGKLSSLLLLCVYLYMSI